MHEQNVFINKYFTKRDPECTNIVACLAMVKPETADDRWIDAPADWQDKVWMLDTIRVENGVTYLGYL